jgi:hypothetical protein
MACQILRHVKTRSSRCQDSQQGGRVARVAGAQVAAHRATWLSLAHSVPVFSVTCSCWTRRLQREHRWILSERTCLCCRQVFAGLLEKPPHVVIYLGAARREEEHPFVERQDVLRGRMHHLKQRCQLEAGARHTAHATATSCQVTGMSLEGGCRGRGASEDRATARHACDIPTPPGTIAARGAGLLGARAGL